MDDEGARGVRGTGADRVPGPVVPPPPAVPPKVPGAGTPASGQPWGARGGEPEAPRVPAIPPPAG
ncbi:hypothetical protein ACPJ20_26790, partial [Streptomyces sp. SAI-25]